VDSALVKAVIKAESNYDNRAISRAGAQGLMQLMPATSRLRNVDNPFNPGQNIDGGVRHLKYLLRPSTGHQTRPGGLQRRRKRGAQVQRRTTLPGDEELRFDGALALRALQRRVPGAGARAPATRPPGSSPS
jgi:hypothetical protein